MGASNTAGIDFTSVNGIRLEILQKGEGPTVLFLHGGLWLGDERTFIDELAAHARVIAPSHPGFGASDPPGSLVSPDDLAYFYLDLIDRFDLDDVVLAGANFGGWVAAEMATKNCGKLAGLVLIDALGIRPGSPTDPVIADIFAIRDSELVKLAYCNPPPDADNLRAITDDDELRRRLRARDGLAYYGWQPYMHNRQLQGRLHRIGVPTLVLWGDSDGVVGPGYGRAYADAIPGARFETVASAGHLAHVEQAVAVAARIGAFAAETVSRHGAMQAGRPAVTA